MQKGYHQIWPYLLPTHISSINLDLALPLDYLYLDPMSYGLRCGDTSVRAAVIYVSSDIYVHFRLSVLVYSCKAYIGTIWVIQ